MDASKLAQCAGILVRYRDENNGSAFRRAAENFKYNPSFSLPFVKAPRYIERWLNGYFDLIHSNFRLVNCIRTALKSRILYQNESRSKWPIFCKSRLRIWHTSISVLFISGRARLLFHSLLKITQKDDKC